MPKVIRILVYEGPQAWLDATLEHNAVKIGKPMTGREWRISELCQEEVIQDG